MFGAPEAPRRPHEFELVQHAGRLHVSIITVGELMTWALRREAPPRRLAGIEAFLREVETLPIDEKVADAFAELRCTTRRRASDCLD